MVSLEEDRTVVRNRCKHPALVKDIIHNRWIRVLASTQTHGHGEETLLSSGWTLIRSELSSPMTKIHFGHEI